MPAPRATWSLWVFGVASALPAAGLAQTVESPGARTALEEIVVTAQRREERLQDVPISVSVASGDKLEAQGIVTAQDLEKITPGLQMAVVRHNIQPYLRAIGTQNTSPGEEGSVAMYLDGVYINYMSAATFGLANVERIEVLKGPQGTLFGRNATGGLIHVITRDPKQDPQIIADFSLADYNTTSAKLYMTGGLAPDLAASLSLYYLDQAEGYGRHLLRGEDVNLRKDVAIHSKLRWDVTEDTSVILSGDWGRHESDIGTTRSVLPGGIGARGGPYDSQANDPNSNITRYWGAHAKVIHSLALADLESLTAYRFYEEKIAFDQDGRPQGSVFLSSRVPVQTFQQEFTLRGSTERLNWSSGVFFYSASAGYQPLTVTSSAAPATNRQTFSNMRTEAYAAYAQGTYELLPATNLTVGVRYTRDVRKIDGANYAFAGNRIAEGTVLSAARQKETFEEPAWRLAIDHQFSEDIMVYASQSRGFKSGIFSATTFANSAVEPETLDATEIGIKSTWFERRLQLNASAYYYDYKNIQLTQVSGGTSRLLNAARGKPRGIDFDMVLLPPVPVGDLQLTAGLSAQKATYTNFPNAPFSSPLPGGGNLQGVRDATGNDMIRAPKFTSQLSADYAVDLGPGQARASIVWAHSSSFAFDPDNRVRQAPYDTINVRLRYSVNDVEFYVFGENVTDERYLTAVSTTNLGDLAVFGRPRAFGVGVRIER